MQDRTEVLFGEAADILVRLREDGGTDAAAIVARIEDTVIPTILMEEDLDLAEVLLGEVVGDIIVMENRREGRAV